MVLIAVILTSLLAVLVKSTPLDDYVNTPDPNYNYTVLTNLTKRITGSFTVYTVNMTSQKWLTENDCDRSIWWHYLLITVPDKIEHPDAAFMFITSGGTNDGPPDPLDNTEVMYTSLIAASTGTVTACLFDIPNQPINFTADPLHIARDLEKLVAFTWKHFLENGTDEPYWLVQLPMTKAVVRAMDTVTNMTHSIRPDLNITRFILAGASKRGWATYLTAAVDNRVIAIAPIVLDLLNMVKNLHHHYRSLGAWSFVMVDYLNENITRCLDDPNFQKMANIIDPLVYKARLTMPKYIISASGDEFFLPDDSHDYFNEMEGKTYMRITQNAEHTMKGHKVDLILNLRAFVLAVLEDWTWPAISWTLSENATHGNIEFYTNVKPEEINTWMAQSLEADGRRDFRLAAAEKPGSKVPFPHAVLYLPYDVRNPSPGIYTAAFEKPAKGWRCFFIRATYTAPRDSSIHFTTEANIIPDGVYPVPDCHGEGCQGTLI